jgi:protein-S-isoprenylcysteine O-methyltransferase Ste14
MTDVADPKHHQTAQRARNFGASFLFLTTAFLVYRFSPHVAALRSVQNDAIQLAAADILTGGYVLYGLILLVFYFTERAPGEAKSVAALRALATWTRSPARAFREDLPYRDRLGLLTMLLKCFYAPLMVMFLFEHTTNLLANGTFIFRHLDALKANFLAVFNSHGYWFLLQLILFLDVAFFTIGYLVEHPRLKNEIRSVDPTWLGWAVTLACYPPFNNFVSQMLGWSVAEFPQFTDPMVHVAANSLLLLLMAIYTSASVALNLKGSNLTHRGIISHGPYRFVRHPAYACKNLAWWIGVAPAVMAAWPVSVPGALTIAGSAFAWSAIYVLRALTEEDHLRKVDGEYDAYCRKVPYRFIPGVY